VADLEHENLIIFNAVDHAVVANAKSEDTLDVPELHHTPRARVLGEGVDASSDPLLGRVGELGKLAGGLILVTVA
jgi:hypothetical protein